MKEIIYWIAKNTGIFLLCRYLTRGDLRILAYHGIWIGDGHFGNFLYMEAGKFAGRMAMLRQQKYPVLELGEALQLRDKGQLPACATVITIDDGWLGTYLYMLPELGKNDLPATVYAATYYCYNQRPVCTVLLQYIVKCSRLAEVDVSCLQVEGLSTACLTEKTDKAAFLGKLQNHMEGLLSDADKQQFCRQLATVLCVDLTLVDKGRWFNLMSVSQMADMKSRGIDVQLHTHRHTLIDSAGNCCLASEIADNRASLAPVTDNSLVHFCYPSGIYDESLWPKLEHEGVISATTTEIGFARKNTHRYALPRILDGQNISALSFEAEMSGFSEILRRLTRRRNG